MTAVGSSIINLSGLGHMTKMVAMPISYGKNLFQNPKPYDLETWHGTLGTEALRS